MTRLSSVSNPPLRPPRLTLLAASLLAVLVSGCALTGAMPLPLDQDEKMVEGPAIAEIVTPFDRALSCLDGRINREALNFSVGSILDSTGKEQLSDGGTNKFVTQGAGDIVQSALFRAGVVVVNRRDPRVMESEARWGIRDTKSQLASTFYITGSINSLDFLPGGGIDAQVAGLGPRYRQFRMLVGLDLSLTETKTGRIMANVPLQKQIVATEEGFNVGRFFGNTLVSLDFGHNKREAVHFAMRQMLNLATFELLTQMMRPEKYVDCYEMIESIDGLMGTSRSGVRIAEYRKALQAKSAAPAGSATKKAAATAASDNAFAAPQGASRADTALKPAPQTENGAESGPTERAQAQADPNSGGRAEAANGVSQASAAYFREESELSTPEALRALELLRSAPLRDAEDAAALSASAARLSGADASEPPPAPLNRSPGESVAPRTPGPAPVVSMAALVGNKTETGLQGRLPANWPAFCHVAHGDKFPAVTPLLAADNGRVLQLRSGKASQICVADDEGKTWWIQLQPGASEKLIGTAPWRLMSPQPLQSFEIEFQGLLMRTPSYVKDRMELFERR